MVATLSTDAKVLVPNKEHKNFTETNEIIPKGTEITGDYKSIKGLRRGKPFSFRVFITQNGQIIYSNNIENMKSTEVLLGADSSVTETNIKLSPSIKRATMGAFVGLAGGYIYANKKGLKGKSLYKYALIGGVLGYTSIYAFDKFKTSNVDK